MKILITMIKQNLSPLIVILFLVAASQLGAQESPNLIPTSSTGTARAIFSMY